MLILVLGLLLFVGVHVVPWLPGLRDALQDRIGRNGYRGLFTLVSVIGLVLIVWGYSRAPYQAVYTPPAWGRPLTLPLMMLALVLFPAAHMKTNLKRFTRHPMLWGLAAWAVAHLLVRGDLASLLLFGGLGAYALVAMWSANRRGARLATTRQPLARDLMVLAAGAIAFLVLGLAHPWLFGARVLPL